ncbi:hypothetical protein OH77DRAFT_1408393 [Trametes cingulata]|nr:hypothetical protein OH77DRAFT_1408393 [Trametes cingulata]
MASGQLSPFASCTDGLGFPNSVDCRSTTSLLTPTASVCTVSSLAQSGDGDGGAGRVRTKTMQTKDILKSPQPHRFHLVPSGRRRTPELPSLSSKPSTQWRFRQEGHMHHESTNGAEEAAIQDLFSPAESPLMPPLEIVSQCRTAHDERPLSRVQDHALGESGSIPVSCRVLTDDRPTSTGSALSVQTASVSYTLVQDQTNKRLSSASASLCKEDLLCKDPIGACPFKDRTHHISSDEAAHDEPLSKTQVSAITCETTAKEICAAITSCGRRNRESDYSVADEANAIHTTSGTLDSLVSKYRSRSSSTYEDPCAPSNVTPSTSSNPERASESCSPSPSALPPARDRRKFALRRQAIYAEYGFQIALPDSDSESSVKVLASPSKRSAQGRAASAYVLSGSNSRSALSVSTTGSVASETVSSGYEDARFGYANDRLERLSVQDDILAATRNPLLEEFAQLTTSTPPAKSRSDSRHPLGTVSAVPCSRVAQSSTSRSQQSWAPLRLRKKHNRHDVVPICVSTSERSARLSAWDVDPGHHPLIQDLIDEVDRAIEQWRWIMQLRTYL